MRILHFSIYTVFISLITFQGSIHDYTVPKIEGGNQSLASYQGLKILVIVLPVNQSATTDSMLYSLDTLASARAGSLKIIAVPSIEDGFNNTLKSQYEQWYRSKLGAGILITEGLYTRRSSGVLQHPLFQWLTDAARNGVFDVDVDGPGYKYFAKGNGNLYGVLKPQSRVGGQGVQRTLQIQ
jgi:glutathione peroxidase